MPSHPDRVRVVYEVQLQLPLSDQDILFNDIRFVLDHLRCEYCSPELAKVLTRLEKVVGLCE